MHFYINILTTYYPDLDPPYDVYYQQILEQIELAEELGWECFMFNEHHFLGYGGLVANPAVLLAAAAARTSRIRLGPCIAILPLRHPLQSAEDYAMVDSVSNGRLEFGIGSGNTLLDYQVFDIQREEGQERLEEALEIILNAWTQRAFRPSGKILELPGDNALPKTGTAAPSADLGRRHIGADSGMGRPQGLRHHDGGPSASTGKSAPGGRGMEKGIDRARHRSEGAPLPIPRENSR